VKGSRADLDGDLPKAAIVIEHLLLTYALQPEACRLKHAGRMNGDAVLNPVRVLKAHPTFANRHMDKVSYSPYLRPTFASVSPTLTRDEGHR
jgi:hypothetical protein